MDKYDMIPDELVKGVFEAQSHEFPIVRSLRCFINYLIALGYKWKEIKEVMILEIQLDDCKEDEKADQKIDELIDSLVQIERSSRLLRSMIDGISKDQ
jgi:hypothetical protein